MNREEIIRMATEAGLLEPGYIHGNTVIAELERFAALVAAAEREDCAKVCSNRAMRCELEANQAIENGERDESSALRSTAWQISVCADEIRARGVQPKD